MYRIGLNSSTQGIKLLSQLQDAGGHGGREISGLDKVNRNIAPFERLISIGYQVPDNFFFFKPTNSFIENIYNFNPKIKKQYKVCFSSQYVHDGAVSVRNIIGRRVSRVPKIYERTHARPTSST